MHDISGADNTVAGIGDLLLEKGDGRTGAVLAEVRREPVAYAGPPIGRPHFYLEPVDTPGHYRLSFVGEPGNAGPEVFAVCAKLQAARSIRRDDAPTD